MAVLSNDEVDAQLSSLHDWQRVDGELRRAVEFPEFLAGVDAVRRVGELAERENHHPDIDIRWRTVTFKLVTHSEGGITAQDLQLAREIDRLVAGS